MRDIPGYPGYLATDEGHIYSKRTGQLKQVKASMHKGYLHVNVKHGVGRSTKVKRPVHQLVLLAHVGPRPSDHHDSRHLNGDGLDNRSINLAWGTRAENVADAIKHGTAVCLRRGLNHPRCRISDADIQDIRAACAAGEAYNSIGRRYRIDPAYISRIFRGLDRAAA